MRETEIRMRNKMHGYARACLDTISKDLKKEIRLYFEKFDQLIIDELVLKQ
jgi:hypothetical protein